MSAAIVRVSGLLAVALGAVTAAAETVQDQFYRAYYLEHAQHDYAAAAEAYAEVAGSRRAPDEIRGEARERAEACREELSSADFARLVPETTLVYAELSRPGAQLERLLGQLGLLREGSLVDSIDQRVAVSPDLVRGLAGLRGAAVAITGFDPQAEQPSGVVILHPGSLDLVRGLIETGLPIAAERSPAIGGFPTYRIEDEVYVTLTHRLVIASQQRGEIEGVVERLAGDAASLAENPAMAKVLAERGDALVFACANFEQIMPLAKMGMMAAAAEEPELAAVLQLLDIESLRNVIVKAGVGEDGLDVDVALGLAEGHRNLAFHFLRMPVIDAGVLRHVPRGAAGFIAGALSDADASYDAGSGPDEPIALLDLGREIFANLQGIALFVMPDAEVVIDNERVPGGALVMTVKDPVKSATLWSQLLGVASLASGQGSLAGKTAKLDGATVRSFALPEGLTMHLAVSDHTLVLSPSDKAVRAALAAGHSESILDDPAFQDTIAAIERDATFAACVHAGRALETARPLMDERDREEIAPFENLLDDLLATFVVQHSASEFRLRARVRGLPNVGPVLTQVIESELQGDRLRREQRDRRAGQWTQLERAAARHDVAAAKPVAEALFAQHNSDANELNTMAWRMLTDDPFAGQEAFARIALRLSERSNELSGHANWMYVDTLARAHYELGDAERAIEIQRKAVELAGGAERADEARAALARFEQAAEARDVAAAGRAPADVAAN